MRHFLRMTDLDRGGSRRLFSRAAQLKRRRREGHLEDSLAGKTVVLLMEKASTRTRLSFAAAAFQLGGHAIELSASTSQLARGEPLSDTARVVSSYADAVVMRTTTDARLEEFVRWSSVPVINGLTDGGHPVQVLTDLFTIEESIGAVAGRRIAFVGDGSGNMVRSFLEAGPIFDFTLQLAAPPEFRPPPAETQAAGRHLVVTADPREAVAGADVVVTDVWTSMGQEAEAAARVKAFRGFTVDAALLAGARPGAIVLHCLPAHRGEEITDEVLEGPQSRVFEEAENRMHVQKALLEQVILGGVQDIVEA
ncbi:MAG TPA: ornithine carbamoyltransferase [Myxococcaceae bacterium]|nr:ornithine carbamoyltransferase [Myxococcaceae bacterium]